MIMDIATIYVGQGALAVVRHQGEAIIVDAHLPSSDRKLRERIETELYFSLHDHRVAGLVLTGFDADHSSPDGVKLILRKYNPDWVMYPKYYKETGTASDVFRVIEHYKRQYADNRLRRVPVRVDDVNSRVLNGLARQFSFELFSPHFEDMDSSNNSSIVLKITTRGENSFSYLVTGDTENSRWERINQIFGTELQSHVLAAPHHGSGNAAHSGVVRSIDPDAVVISAGHNNQYGHPHSQALKIYRSVTEHVHATNLDGVGSLFTKKSWGRIETVKRG